METGLVRVSVASATRRVDLALPGSVPIAELLPELARSVGVLDPASAARGHRLARVGGEGLSAAAGLTEQGVEDGALLFLTSGAVPAPRRYDDVTEAFAEAVRSDEPPWSMEAGRRTALLTAALVLVLGASSAGALRSERWAPAALAVAAVLGCLAVAVSRRCAQPSTALLLAWLSVPYAGVAGVLTAPAGPLLGTPLVVAGAAASVAGALLMAVLDEDRTLLIPAVAGGALLSAVGLAAARDGPLAVRVVLVLLAASALVQAAAPTIAVMVVHTEVDPEDGAVVAQDARTARRILLAMQAAVAAVVVAATPVAVALSCAGAAVAADATVMVMLRARHHRAWLHRAIGLLAGITAAAGGLVTALLTHPAWRPELTALATTVGLGVLLATLLPATARRARAAELAEAVVTVALLPLLVAAVGLLGWAHSRGASPW